MSSPTIPSYEPSTKTVSGVQADDIFKVILNLKLTNGQYAIYSQSVYVNNATTPLIDNLTISGGGIPNKAFQIPKTSNRKTRQIYNKTFSNRNK